MYKFMKNKILFLIFFILFISFNNVYATATEDELAKITSFQNEINNIKSQKEKVADTIKRLNSLKNDVEKFIEELDKSLNELINELNNILDAIDELQVQLNETTSKLEVAKKNEEEQYADMKTRIKFFYERNDITAFESILNGDNLNDILTKAEYISSISDYDRKKLDELIQIKKDIEELEEKLNKEKEVLVGLKEEENAKKDSIEQLLFEKKKELDDMNSEINKSQKELKKLEQAEKAQEANIKAIEEAIEKRERAKKESARVLKGGLIWPLPSSHRITSNFGKRTSPKKGASSNHQGIDIGAPTGDKVIAAASGEVVIAKYSVSAGNYIMISHGSQIYTIYMHLSKMSVKEGDEVVKGQKIGEVGSTGYSTGPHLHFGIRKNGVYVDPLTYVG